MIPNPSKTLSVLALFGFLLRASIPAGYMPASVEDGSFVKLCPDGLSAEVMTALLGHDHAHHSGDEMRFVQCDLSIGQGEPLAIGPVFETPHIADSVTRHPNTDSRTTTTSSRYRCRPRSPPISRFG